MSYKQSDKIETLKEKTLNSKPPHISCPECSKKVPDELGRLLLNGKDVFCEQCGFHFTGISSQGEVKPLSQQFKANEDSVPQTLTKRESEWVTWKEEWEKLKVTWKKSMHEWKTKWKEDKKKVKESHGYSVHSTSKASAPGVYTTSLNVGPAKNVSYQPTQSFSAPSKKSAPRPSSLPSPPPMNTRSSKSEIEQMKDALYFLIKFTPIFYIIIGIVTVGIFFGGIFAGGIGFLRTLGVLFLQIILIIIDLNEFIPVEQEGKIPNKGYPLILLGVIGLSVYGLGTLMLVRGILYVMIYTKTHPEYLESPERDAMSKKMLEDWKAAIVVRDLLRAFIPYSARVVIGIYLAALLMCISIVTAAGVAYMIVSIVLTSIALGLFLGILYPKLLAHYDNLENINEKTGAFLIILGCFASVNGMGVILMFIAILILILTDGHKKFPDLLPAIDVNDENLVYNPKESLSKSTSKRCASSHSQDHKPTSSSPKQNFMLVSTGRNAELDGKAVPDVDNITNSRGEKSPVHAFDPKTGKLRKFDPRTGKMIVLGENDEIRTVGAPERHEKDPNGKEPEKKDENSGESVKRIYTVLDPEVRKQFKNLKIEKSEKRDIIRNLIYLSKEQQLKYLEEFAVLNSEVQEKITEELIDRIGNLALKRGSHDLLIRQLEYIPLEEQEEYVKFLEEQVQSS